MKTAQKKKKLKENGVEQRVGRNGLGKSELQDDSECLAWGRLGGCGGAGEKGEDACEGVLMMQMMKKRRKKMQMEKGLKMQRGGK